MRTVDEKKHWVFRIVIPCEKKTEKLKNAEEEFDYKQKFLIGSSEKTN